MGNGAGTLAGTNINCLKDTYLEMQAANPWNEMPLHLINFIVMASSISV
jgi:hypothetical protein